MFSLAVCLHLTWQDQLIMKPCSFSRWLCLVGCHMGTLSAQRRIIWKGDLCKLMHVLLCLAQYNSIDVAYTLLPLIIFSIFFTGSWFWQVIISLDQQEIASVFLVLCFILLVDKFIVSHVIVKLYFFLRRNIPAYLVNTGQYHGCWCPGSLSFQRISRHGIDSIR